MACNYYHSWLDCRGERGGSDSVPSFISSVWTPLVATGPLVVSLGISFVVGVFLTVKGYWG